jgi:hypothetical protein
MYRGLLRGRLLASIKAAMGSSMELLCSFDSDCRVFYARPIEYSILMSEYNVLMSQPTRSTCSAGAWDQ